jgi:hypothetical protein
MAKVSLRDTLDSIRDGINSRSRFWENVILNFTEGYDIAYKNHTDNLPTKMVESPAVAVIFATLTTASTAWLSGGWVVAMTPLTSVITSIGEKIGEVADDSVTKIPGVSASSASYFRSLKSALNSFEGNVLEYIRKCRYKLDKGDIKILPAERDKYLNLLQLSPYWFPPKNLSSENKALQEELAVEFEIGFWAEWGKQLAKASPNEIVGYDFDKASIRLEKLNVKIPGTAGVAGISQQDFSIENAKKGRGRSIGGGMNNRIWAQDVVAWGEKYVSKKQFGDPLPANVQNYILQKQSPLFVDLLKMGYEFLKGRGIVE